MACELSDAEGFDPAIVQMILEHPKFDHNLIHYPELMRLTKNPAVVELLTRDCTSNTCR